MSGNQQNRMSKADSERIQSSQATSGKDMSSGGFAARAQGAGDRNANVVAGNNNAGQGGNTRGSNMAGNKK